MTELDKVDGSLTWVEQSFREAQGMPSNFNSLMSDHFRRIMANKKNMGKFGVRVGDSEKGGMVVNKVSDGSAAEEAGLLAGDILLVVNGRKIKARFELRRSLAGLKKGAEISAVYLRDGVRKSLDATLK